MLVICSVTVACAKQDVEDGRAKADVTFEDALPEDVVITYEDVEGEQRIRDISVRSVKGEKALFPNGSDTLTDEERAMTLEDVKAFDFDYDAKAEYVLLFDTHGAGGNGSHEAWVLWMEDTPRFEVLSCLDSFMEGERDGIDGGVDTLYQVDHVDEDCGKMLTYQYTYQEGRSDYQGDLVTLVKYDEDKKTFVRVDSWKEKDTVEDERNEEAD